MKELKYDRGRRSFKNILFESKEIDAVDDTSGLTKEEKMISDSLVSIWENFVKLEQTHPDDVNDVHDAIHQIQYVLGMRSLRRLFPKQWITHNSKG